MSNKLWKVKKEEKKKGKGNGPKESGLPYSDPLGALFAFGTFDTSVRDQRKPLRSRLSKSEQRRKINRAREKRTRRAEKLEGAMMAREWPG